MQGQGLRDRVSEFSELGAVVVGASFDTVEEQKKFADEQGFSFSLISFGTPMRITFSYNF